MLCPQAIPARLRTSSPGRFGRKLQLNSGEPWYHLGNFPASGVKDTNLSGPGCPIGASCTLWPQNKHP